MINRPISGRAPARLMAAVTLAYAAALFWATHAPHVLVPTFGPPGMPTDKIMHLAGYGALGLLAMLTVKSWRPKACALPFMLVILPIVAAIDELTQPLTFRDAEWLDWVADVLGIAVGASLAAALAGSASSGEDPAA